MRKYILRGEHIINAHKKRTVQFHKEVYLREDFRELWERINQQNFLLYFFQYTKINQKCCARNPKYQIH